MSSASLRLLHLALVLVGLGGPLAYVAASPVYSSGDEAAHVDYAYQVWLGQLPVFEDGLVIENPTGSRPPVQWTSQHPPLLYVLLAPVVGPLVDAGHVAVAGMAARLVIVLLAVALVFSVRWFARLAMPTRPDAADLAAVLTGLSVWYIRLGGSVYNDILAALTIVLATALLLAMTRSGHPGLVTGFVVALCAASLTRISLLPLCFLLLSALLLHRWRREGRPLLQAAALPFAAGCAVLLASGWFYLRNLRLTESLTGGHPEWAIAHLSREPRSFLDVAVDRDFWTQVLQQFSVQTFRAEPWPLVTSAGIIVLFLFPLALGLYRAARPRRGDMDILALGMIMASSCVVAVTQIHHVAGAGAAAPRYFFILVPFLAPLMALGLWCMPAAILMIGAWLATRLTLIGVEIASTLAREWTKVQAPIFPAVAWTGFLMLLTGTLLALVLIAGNSTARFSQRDRSRPAQR